MKRIEVSDTAAARIEALRDDDYLNMTKATICDLLCEIVSDADTDGTEKRGIFAPLGRYRGLCGLDKRPTRAKMRINNREII